MWEKYFVQVKIEQYLELLREKLDLEERLNNEGCPLCQRTTAKLSKSQREFVTRLGEKVICCCYSKK